MNNMLGKNFVCGGIVTGIRNGVTKRGDPYLVAKVEDMTGASEFPLFSRNYAKFAPYFALNAYVCISGSVEKSQYNDRTNVNIADVCYLSDLMKRGSVHAVTFNIDLDKVADEMMQSISAVLMENRHKPVSLPPDARPYVPVKFHVVSSSLRIDARLTSQTHCAQLGPELMRVVDETDGIEMSIG